MARVLVWMVGRPSWVDATLQADADGLRRILGVSRETLEGAVQAMEAQYGSIDRYIEQGLGIDKATRLKLQTLLLE